MRTWHRIESSWRLLFAGTSIVVLTNPTHAQVVRVEPGASLLPPVTITSPDQAGKKRAQRSERPARMTSVRRPAQRARPSSLQRTRPGISGALVASPGRSDVSSSVTALPAATTVLDAPRISQLPVTTYGDMFARCQASTSPITARARSAMASRCAVTPRRSMAATSPISSMACR